MSYQAADFSPQLNQKILSLAKHKKTIQLGSLTFSSPLLLAPMAGICSAPFRQLMQDLGAGGTVSELISCHGINYGNQLTLNMLKTMPHEKEVGIQLFGEDAAAMAKAAQTTLEHGKAQFIDINMGCPVKKVVTKGGGSALMKDLKKLPSFLAEVKKSIPVPLTIKIRTGWQDDDRNAAEIIKIASEEGIEWVAIHGRTRAQQYTGRADWEFIENLAQKSALPLIGNGDLHSAHSVYQRLQKTHCRALMIARGALRNPFIFLEGLSPCHQESIFIGSDYWEVLQRLHFYLTAHFDRPSIQLIQFRKLAVWFAAGFANASHFRSQMFAAKGLQECLSICQDYFLSLQDRQKNINYDEIFMTSGHG